MRKLNINKKHFWNTLYKRGAADLGNWAITVVIGGIIAVVGLAVLATQINSILNNNTSGFGAGSLALMGLIVFILVAVMIRKVFKSR